MHLIVIYGPPAVGKLTVAKALAKDTGFALVDNHTLVNPIAHVFGWDHPERERLGVLFRLELFRSAAKANISLITTLGGGGKTFDSFIQDIQRTVRNEGGETLFVRLTAPREVLFHRVQHDSRTSHQKMTAPETLQKSLDAFPDVMERALVEPHLELDSTLHLPENMAKIITDTYHLPSKTDALVV